MKIGSLFVFLSAVFVMQCTSLAATLSIGDEVEIRRSYENSQEKGEQSSGSSSGHDTILQRVVSVGPDGTELVYDLPHSATREERARDWTLPARVFQPTHGPLRLLNQDQLEARLTEWLKSANWDRAMCGRWIFTWNAFRIECDPQSVIETINSFNLRVADLRAGAPYSDENAEKAGILVTKDLNGESHSFSVEMPVNKAVVHRERAEADVAIGVIMQKPISFETALMERQKEVVTGTVSVTLEADESGQVVRRIRVIKLKTNLPDGSVETQINKQTVERLPGLATAMKILVEN